MSLIHKLLLGAALLAGAFLIGCQPEPAGKKILYYVNPMAPSMRSDKPAKDPMGMDYVAVYADQAGNPEAVTAKGQENADRASVSIDVRVQQLIGVKRDTVQKREMTKTLRVSGRVSHETDLYGLEEEYLAALRYVNQARAQGAQEDGSAARLLLEAARSKLLLAGFSSAEIEQLARRGTSDRSLVFNPAAGGGWVEVAVSETDLALVRPGALARIGSPAFPGKTFTGQVAGIEPVLDPVIRAAKVRIVSTDLPRALSHESFVTVEIGVKLGVRLAVSEDAVVDTGRRQIAFVITADNKFEPRTVTLGETADGYVEITSGLAEGEIVAAAANFLIDSESQFKAALGKM
jgi:hypothetical protein